MNTQFQHSGRNCKLLSVCLNAGKYVAGILCTATKNGAHYKVEPCNYGVSVWGTVGGKTCFLYPSSGLQLIELSGLFLLLDNMFRKHSDPDFEQIYLFLPGDLFSARTFLHLRRQLWINTLYSLVIRAKLSVN